MIKDKFYEVRQSSLNSPEKRLIEYHKKQNADKKQLKHLKGNKQLWK